LRGAISAVVEPPLIDKTLHSGEVLAIPADRLRTAEYSVVFDAGMVQVKRIFAEGHS
jgi:hypothetical protein